MFQKLPFYILEMGIKLLFPLFFILLHELEIFSHLHQLLFQNLRSLSILLNSGFLTHSPLQKLIYNLIQISINHRTQTIYKHYKNSFQILKEMMKRKIIRAQPHKILQEQSGKLKEKLQLLKQQIQQKKKEKEMGKNHLTESSASKSKVNLNSNSQNNTLANLFASLQMEHLVNKLKQKNINTLQQFRSIQPQVVDHWKDIPVGYRIKIKKQLNNALKQSLSPSPQKKLSLDPKKGIEDIIQGRKKDKIFVPLNHEEQIQYGELSENQQQQMIESLMRAFNPAQQIEEIQLQKNEKPQVVVQSKQAWGIKQNYPQYQYCWTCLKMLTENQLNYKDRFFCSQNCTDKYKSVVEIEQNTQFFDKIQNTENIFTDYIQNRKKGKGEKKRVNKNIQIDIQQQIGFQIA